MIYTYKKKYYNRILSTLLIITVLFVSVIFSVYLFKTNQLNSRNLEHSNQLLREQTKRNLDNSFNIVYRLALKLKSEKAILNYNLLGGDDYLSEIQIRELLKTYTGLFYDYDYEMAIFSPKSGKVMTGSVEIMESSDYLKQTSIDPDALKRYIENGSSEDFYMLPKLSGEKENVFFISPLFSGIENHIFVIVEYKVAEMLRKFQNSANVIVSVADKDGTILVEMTNDENMKNGEEMFINGDNYFGFQYRYFYQKQSVSPISILPLILLVFMIALAISVLASKILYRPVYYAVKRFSEYDGEYVGNEFEFFDKTIHKYADANKELIRTVRDHKSSMRISYIKELIHNSRYMDLGRKGTDLYKIDVLKGEYSVSIIEFENFSRLSQMLGNSELIDLKNNIQQIIAGELSKYCKFELIDYSYHNMVLIADADKNVDLKSILMQLILFIEVECDINLIAAIGKVCIDSRNVSVSYEDALAVMEYQSALSNQRVLTYDDVKDWHNSNLYYPLEIEQSIIEATLDGNKERVYMILHSLIERNFSGKKEERDIYSQFKLSIVMTMKRILYKMNFRQEDIFGEDCILYLEFGLREKNQDLEMATKALFEKIFEHLSEDGCQKSKKLINRILEYVKNNFTRDISLTDLSETFNLSISYISRLFKRELNMNFKDVIAKYRLEEAKRLLAQGMKVQEVGERCGFNNTSVFVRFFKRYEGMPPAKYQHGIHEPTSGD
ncbi:helix-turn-helix domain-containing protein [Ructibacterium gallinarum]|uniref:Helix-turn-helix transcriptional regulator n=1 Tax=Ructibacterium gallinarum TaxID=2779355 RepID=A0A9D5LWZ7_9FIRM|nr:AraC family transcriptional regulator [Ructibacterium gallinarum]MBE5039331.1 helix-turn-helix transcriptional regulator [Ructibacterium gallinarum]